MSEIISDSEKIELLSEDVQEIIGQVPPWIIRWGTTVIFTVVILLIAGCFVLKYPDVITSSVIILSENPSASIVARTSGKIDNLLVQNEKTVKQDEILAILENSANSSHIFDLKQKLDRFSAFFDAPLSPILSDFSNNYSLGPVQPAFSNFQRQYQDFQNYVTVNIIGKKINSVRRQYSDYTNYIERLKIQADNQGKTMELTRKQFLRDSSLFTKGVIAPADYEKSEQSFLQVKNSYQSVLATVSNTQMQMNQLNYQIIDLESQQMDKVQTSLHTLKEAYDNLKANIRDWEKSYLLIAPIDGKISFNQFWSKNQYVTAGEVVFTIVPNQPQHIIGRVKLPVSGSGKVRIGQKVLIRLDNFPYNEFGMVEARVKSISLIPEIKQQETYYTAEVSLYNGLLTNYKKKLPFNQEMQGSAEIITKNLTLFERLFNPLKSAIYKN